MSGWQPLQTTKYIYLESYMQSSTSFTSGTPTSQEELKRLYTQLEVYKTKSLRIDNPHLPSKKKSNVSKWRAPRRFSRGYSLRTHSGHSESERSSEIARSNESLGKAVELHDYRVNHVDPADQSHCSSQKWLCQQ